MTSPKTVSETTKDSMKSKIETIFRPHFICLPSKDIEQLNQLVETHFGKEPLFFYVLS